MMLIFLYLSNMF